MKETWFLTPLLVVVPRQWPQKGTAESFLEWKKKLNMLNSQEKN